jgi:hypothetical protein
MSALPPKADIEIPQRNVRYVPKADIGTHPRDVRFVPKADSCIAAKKLPLNYLVGEDVKM